MNSGKIINKNERQWLKLAINNDLISAFKKLGFETFPLPEQFMGMRVMKTAYPFGVLRRSKQNTVEIIEVSLFDPGRVGFDIHFGIVPASGYEHPITGNIPVEKIYLTYLKHFYRAYQCRLIGKSFSLCRWPGRELQQTDYERLDSVVIR